MLAYTREERIWERARASDPYRKNVLCDIEDMHIGDLIVLVEPIIQPKTESIFPIISVERDQVYTIKEKRAQPDGLSLKSCFIIAVDRGLNPVPGSEKEIPLGRKVISLQDKIPLSFSLVGMA